MAARPAATPEQLFGRWPARRLQISQLLRLLGRPSQAGTNIFVCGAPKTGKTTIVRGCLAALGRRYAYFEAGDTVKPRQLLSSLLSQLHEKSKRTREMGYASSVCDSIPDFLVQLQCTCPRTQPTRYIVIDNAHALADSPLLEALVRAQELTGANVAVILINSSPWGTHSFLRGLHAHVMPQVVFPAYQREELIHILTQVPPPDVRPSTLRAEVWPHFIQGLVVDQFSQLTRSIADLKALAAEMWREYSPPLGAMEPGINVETAVRKLLQHASSLSLVDRYLRVMEPGMCHPSHIAAAISAAAQQGSGAVASREHEDNWGAMPFTSRLLLVAAYVASYNKSTLDKAVFDAGGRSGRIRGRHVALDSDRQAEAAKEAKLKGPHSFPLSRLLTIYNYLYSQANHQASATQHQQAKQQQGGVEALDLLPASFVTTQAELDVLEEMDLDLGGAQQQDQGTLAGAGGQPGQGLAGSSLVPSRGQAGAPGQGLSSSTQAGAQEQGQGDSQPASAAHAEDLKAHLARLKASKSKKGGAPAPAQGAGPGQGAMLSSRQGSQGQAVDAGGQNQQQGSRGMRGAGGGSSWASVDAPCSHLPHPGSGCVRGGRALLSPEPPSLFSALTSLVASALLVKSQGEDLVDGQCFCVSSLSLDLAHQLARDCGLDLSNYLRYA